MFAHALATDKSKTKHYSIGCCSMNTYYNNNPKRLDIDDIDVI